MRERMGVKKNPFQRMKTDSVLKKRGTRGDIILLVTVIMLALYGTVMVASAGYSFAELRYGDAFYFIKRQAVWLLI